VKLRYGNEFQKMLGLQSVQNGNVKGQEGAVDVGENNVF